jgi:hypothetical protein
LAIRRFACAGRFSPGPVAIIVRIFARRSTARFRAIWNRDLSPFL